MFILSREAWRPPTVHELQQPTQTALHVLLLLLLIHVSFRKGQSQPTREGTSPERPQVFRLQDYIYFLVENWLEINLPNEMTQTSTFHLEAGGQPFQLMLKKTQRENK